MNLTNKEVVHETFGTGNVVEYDDSYITINFESGDKKFVFPDAFKKFIIFNDEDANKLVREKIEEKEEELRKEALILEKERLLEEERQRALEQERLMKTRKIQSNIQSVFWSEGKEEEERIFTEWKVFSGTIKSGKRKGQVRRFARMNQGSGCLITRRESDVEEKERQIIGLFMTKESFDGGSCDDGYIVAHPNYRIQLSEEESEKMLFWTYYYDKKFPDRMIWNSGRQRYFDNILMAQILRDLISLKEKPEEKEYVQSFFDYFCKINRINKDEILAAQGALTLI